MPMKTTLITCALLFVAADIGWSCNPVTYASCTGTELRAIQQQQFNARKRQPTDAGEYWRDRQYADRIRSEERSHELEIEKLRSETAVEVAKQERRSWRRSGYYFLRPPAVVHPKPVPPIVVKPEPYLRGAVYSNTTHKKVPKAVK